MPRLVVSLALAGVALGAAAASSAATVTPCRGCTVQRIVLVESRATTTTSVPVVPGAAPGSLAPAPMPGTTGNSFLKTSPPG